MICLAILGVYLGVNYHLSKMANRYYLISEVLFFDNKDDAKTRDFVSGTGINLNQPCSSKMPTVEEIKRALIEYGLETKEISNQNNVVELEAVDSKNDRLRLIFNEVRFEDEPIGMFEIGRWSNPKLIIEFIKFLSISHGNFLCYCDSGAMSLITENKDTEKINNEIFLS